MKTHDPQQGVIWYGGRHPSELTPDDFIQLHRTGYIPDTAYERYRTVSGLTWLGLPADYPVLAGTVSTLQCEVTLRQTGQLNRYVAHDADGQILRDTQGLALMLSDREVVTRGLPRYDQTIAAFHGDFPIGWVSNEWGAVGCWIAEPYQRRGIGTQLVRMYLLASPSSRLGQMTSAGIALARAVHRTFTLPGRGLNNESRSQDQHIAHRSTHVALKEEPRSGRVRCRLVG